MFSNFKYKNLIEACIIRTCCKHKIKIAVMFVMLDYVHFIGKTVISINPSRFVQLIKGASSFFFFRFHPKVKPRYPKGYV